jgi:hypothetical protein
MDILQKTLSFTTSTQANPDGFNNNFPVLGISEIINNSSIKASFSVSHWNNLIIIRDWVFNYLMRPHIDVGRSGPVCPYVPKAVHEDSIYLSVISADHFNKSWLYQNVLNYMEQFKLLSPTSGKKSVFRSIILLIDIKNVNLEETVERAITDLKLEFVENKLMLGEFHSGPPENQGIRNPDFRPLESPLPLLVIRTMVETDIEFLKINPMYMMHYDKFFPNKNFNT